MTQLQAIRWFVDYVAGEHVIIPKQREDWQIALGDTKPRLTLPPDLTAFDDRDKLFRADFIRRCPLARGFANVTISILHELGHHFNRESVIFAEKLEGDTMEEHIRLPQEIIATDWAIEWLHDSNNRKVAKEFERDFFGYGKS